MGKLCVFVNVCDRRLVHQPCRMTDILCFIECSGRSRQQPATLDRQACYLPCQPF